MANDPPIPVHIHGLRNKTATFAGGDAGLVVGGITGPSYASDQNCVLLTVEGRDKKSTDLVDIEIAIPFEHIARLIALLIDRSRED